MSTARPNVADHASGNDSTISEERDDAQTETNVEQLPTTGLPHLHGQPSIQHDSRVTSSQHQSGNFSSNPTSSLPSSYTNPSAPSPPTRSSSMQESEVRQRQPLPRTDTPGEASTNTIRGRAMTGAVNMALVTAAVGGTYLLSENDTLVPFAIAACVATFSSVFFRCILSPAHFIVNRGQFRYSSYHRRLTGEQADYARISERLTMIDRDFTDADYELLLDLDNHSQRFRRFLNGASEQMLTRLRTHIYHKPVDASERPNADITEHRCLICLDDFEEGMTIHTLPCSHQFMAECIGTWLAQQARCPVCKQRIEEEGPSVSSVKPSQ